MTVTEQSEVAQRSMIPELAVWTFATGLVDAVTYLKLGHVFTANMTGNVVFSGFVVGGEESILILNVLAAVVGFAVGAFFCGRVLIPRFQAYRLIRLSLATQIVISLLALVVAFFAPGAMKTIAFALGASMGVQNAAARKIAVPDFTTTVLTMTVTGLFADKTSWSKRLRRISTIVLMFAGAVVGSLMALRVGTWQALAVLLVALIVALALSLRPEVAGVNLRR